MTISNHTNTLRTKTEQWQQHFPWHIAFWGLFADRMPKEAVLPQCPTFTMNLGAGLADKTRFSQGPPITETERYTNGNN